MASFISPTNRPEKFAIVFFESESDYARGDAALDAMPTEGSPSRRVSIAKYEDGRGTRRSHRLGLRAARFAAYPIPSRKVADAGAACHCVRCRGRRRDCCGCARGATKKRATDGRPNATTRLAAAQPETTRLTRCRSVRLAAQRDEGRERDQAPVLCQERLTTTVAVGQSCPLSLAFDPSAIGDQSATITIVASGPGTAHTARQRRRVVG
jgi:hypothetical protein